MDPIPQLQLAAKRGMRIVWIAGCVSVFLMIVSAAIWWHQRRVLRAGERTTATIVRLDPVRFSRSRSENAVARFTTRTGEVVEVVNNPPISFMSREVGEVLPIVYDPQDPKRIVVLRWSERALLYGALGLFALIWAVGSLYTLRNVRIIRASIRKLER